MFQIKFERHEVKHPLPLSKYLKIFWYGNNRKELLKYVPIACFISIQVVLGPNESYTAIVYDNCFCEWVCADCTNDYI